MREFELFEYIKDLPVSNAQEEVGHTAWVYLHTLAKWIPNEPTAQAKAFEALKWIAANLPCGGCAQDATNYISNHPFSGNFRKYIIDFHNHVNNNQKKEFVPENKVFQPYILRQKSPMQDFVFEVMVSLK